MGIYSVMLEGRAAGKGFFITFDVASSSSEEAVSLALSEAPSMELNIVGPEEITVKQGPSRSRKHGVVRTYGKSLFDL